MEVRKYMASLYGENKTLTTVPEDAPTARCANGIFVGKRSAGVCSFKGIPYALPPTGERRWQRAVPVPDGQTVCQAFYFGPSPIQTTAASERASYYRQSEDCLYLNVWTADSLMLESKRPVMVWIHGGSYGWGGTSDPLYDGQNFVRTHPDVVLVTIGYRTGIMGFIDLSTIPGGEAFKDAPNLGLLDQVEALRWVKRNISAFGGDPNNVTIFGESAGGGSVSLLPLIPEAKGLFQRVIAESGSIALTYSRDECQSLTRRLLKRSKASSMADLMALSEEQLMELNEDLNEYNCFPQRDGRILPEDLFQSYRHGDATHVDMLIGTNRDEARYWIGEMGGTFIYKLLLPVLYRKNTKRLSLADRDTLQLFRRSLPDGTWPRTEFYNEVMFRIPAICQAEAQAANGHPAYMYYWTKPSSLRNRGACHAVELAYVFNNLDETIYTGEPADSALASEVGQMWVNFARTGNPSTARHAWPAYECPARTTMFLGSDIHCEDDPLPKQRRTMMPMMKYHFNGSYADILP